MIMLDLQLQNINYQNLLKDISLRLHGSHITCIMGANGVGKSLLLKIISGLLPMDSGVIKNEDKIINPKDLPIAIGLQHPIMLRRSVEDNLKVALCSANIKKSHWQDRINFLLAWGNLQHCARQSARLLSGGEKQKLSLLRALAGEPKLLLLDEPCANLDLSAMRSVEELIKESSNKSMKICFVTHDIMQARRLADEVIFMHAGRICEVSRAEDFFNSAKSAEARHYLQGRL